MALPKWNASLGAVSADGWVRGPGRRPLFYGSMDAVSAEFAAP
jgi:hypothetical protein